MDEGHVHTVIGLSLSPGVWQRADSHAIAESYAETDASFVDHENSVARGRPTVRAGHVPLTTELLGSATLSGYLNDIARFHTQAAHVGRHHPHDV